LCDEETKGPGFPALAGSIESRLLLDVRMRSYGCQVVALCCVEGFKNVSAKNEPTIVSAQETKRSNTLVHLSAGALADAEPQARLTHRQAQGFPQGLQRPRPLRHCGVL